VTRKDYYEVLEVRRDADQREVKESYRRLAFHYHPDRNRGNAGAVEKMKEINEAYAVLSDVDKRREYDHLSEVYGPRAYDRFRQAYSERDIFRGSDIGQVFEEMTRVFGFRGFEDLFKDSYGDQGPKKYEFRGPGMFGRVIVFGSRRAPAGREVRAGERTGILGRLMERTARYVLRKMLGESGVRPQDVYETIGIGEDDARRGGKVEYTDARTSQTISITIPPGIGDGQHIRLKGMGDGGIVKGDLYLKVEMRQPFFRRVKEFLRF
jgi:DnaJ-class molecular chaperone